MQTIDTERIIAVAQDADGLRAVAIRAGTGGVEIEWARHSDARDWVAFASECGLSTDPGANGRSRAGTQVAVGLDTLGLTFHCLTVPPVTGQEMDALVRMQAETRSPLPLDQVQLAWRRVGSVDPSSEVALAIARRRHLETFVDRVRTLKPDAIIICAEALVAVWSKVFAPGRTDGIVVSCEGRSTVVCLAEHGRLRHVQVLDLGIDDLWEGDHLRSDVLARFAKELQSVLEVYRPWGAEVAVLSDGSNRIDRTVQALKGAGVTMQSLHADPRRVAGPAGLDVQGLYEYRVPIGLALVAAEPRGAAFDLCAGLYVPPGHEPQVKRLSGGQTAAIAAGVMLAVAVLIGFGADWLTHRRLVRVVSEAKLDQWIKANEYRKAVARYRPDLLTLLEQIDEGQHQGISLDGIYIKRGQPVKITGQAEDPDQVYKFEEGLQTREGFKNVVLEKPTRDQQGNKIRFTVNFNYKDFTQRASAKVK